MKEKKGKQRVPAFATEAEEADWWYKNRKKLDRRLMEAARSGKLPVLDRKTLLQRIEGSKASKVVSIRLAKSDLELARSQASRRGLPYQTYIKSVLHQALEARAKRQSGTS
jgi:predicted DNA binding CopG/RHH family protein